jgi:uncharacterized protein (TIGR02588 family)
MNQSEQAQSLDQTEPQQAKRSPAEWITFSIASLILAAVIGLVVYVSFDPQNQQPPVLSVQRDSAIRESGGQFYVPFSIINTGGDTAESVQIIAELQINGEVVEEGEQSIDFLSSNETEEGAFVFSRNPNEGELTIRVASYKLP